jgi:hypothetical protein
VLAFISPQLVSGRICRSPLMGEGSPYMAEAAQLRECTTVASARDVLITGYLREPL